jgi:hypothetical protein
VYKSIFETITLVKKGLSLMKTSKKLHSEKNVLTFSLDLDADPESAFVKKAGTGKCLNRFICIVGTGTYGCCTGTGISINK